MDTTARESTGPTAKPTGRTDRRQMALIWLVIALGGLICIVGPVVATSMIDAARARRDSAVAPDDLVIVIPDGTDETWRRGETGFRLPDRITVRVGQPIVLRNEDRVAHQALGVSVLARGNVRRAFSEPGELSFRRGADCVWADDDDRSIVEVLP